MVDQPLDGGRLGLRSVSPNGSLLIQKVATGRNPGYFLATSWRTATAVPALGLPFASSAKWLGCPSSNVSTTGNFPAGTLMSPVAKSLAVIGT